MTERDEDLSEKLDKHFKRDNLKLKTMLLVDRISEVSGITELILAKFNTAQFRFYVTWEREGFVDQPRIQGIWEDIFENEDLKEENDPIIIQYPKNEYQAREWRGFHKYSERWMIWKRNCVT